jgi:hypothetical protein
MHSTPKLLTLAGSLAFVVAPLLAQGDFTPPTPAQVAQHHVARLAGVLALSTEQQTSALTLFTNEESAVQPLHQTERTLRTTMQTAIAADNVPTIATTATQLGSVQGQIEGYHATAEAAFLKLLTSDQQTRYTAMHERGPRGFGGGPAGGPPPPPPAE